MSKMASVDLSTTLPFMGLLPSPRHLWWHFLSEAEKRALKDHVPEHIASIVDGLTREEMDSLYFSIGPRNTGLYCKGQCEWARDTAWYLGHKIFRRPTDVEVVDEMTHNGNLKRYRLCYLAMHPEETTIGRSATTEGLDLATDFFEEVLAARTFYEGAARSA